MFVRLNTEITIARNLHLDLDWMATAYESIMNVNPVCRHVINLFKITSKTFL